MKTLALIDTETTSTSPDTGRLVEVALGLWSVPHRSLIRARTWLLEGETNEAEHVNGIPAALLSRGVPREEVERQLHNILVKEADVAVAYNADFDRSWFLPEVQKARPWICAMDDLEWPRAGQDKRLTSVALAHGVGVVHAHCALSDVMTLVALLERVAELMIHEEVPSHDTPSGMEPAFDAWLARALRPKAVFVNADRGYDPKANEAYKAAGFRWHPSQPSPAIRAGEKVWWKKCFRDDVGKLPFKVAEVRS